MPTGNRQKKRPTPFVGWPLRILGKDLLGVAAQCLDAFGAEIFPHLPTTFKNGHALDIGLELPLGTHVRVTHIVPKTGHFSATIALGHCFYPQETSPIGERYQCKGDQVLVAAVKSLPQPQQ